MAFQMNQKIENVLDLALSLSEREREKYSELSIGYDSSKRRWKLIIRYVDSLEQVQKLSDTVTELLNGYAILSIREDRIKQLAKIPEVEFIEKPKSLYFQEEIEKEWKDKYKVPNQNTLQGEGVLIGIVDSGIDYTHPAFQNPDGSTRILALWDQTIPGNAPKGYRTGTMYTREDINEALKKTNRKDRMQIVPSEDVSGHGTAVAGIAAGSVYGVAAKADLIVVKMGIPEKDGFPRTTELMAGVDFVIRKAMEVRKPIAVNVSFGNTYGPHDGTSLVERFIDDLADLWKNVICIGAGNEGAASGHAEGVVKNEMEEIEFVVSEREFAFSIQIWKSFVDEIEISIIGPEGECIKLTEPYLPSGEVRFARAGTEKFSIGNTELLVYYGEPKPYSVKQEIYISLIPKETYLDAGLWKIQLHPVRIVEGRYQMWLPSESALNIGTAFSKPSRMNTLTIPSMAARAITVAAYDPGTRECATFSGRGDPNVGECGVMIKPDLAAPGVKIPAPVSGGGYQEFSGTSFATPFVTGSSAILMEWGILKGKDPYMYGEKVKAYLRRGAMEVGDYDRWPNAWLGYGILTLEESYLLEEKK